MIDWKKPIETSYGEPAVLVGEDGDEKIVRANRILIWVTPRLGKVRIANTLGDALADWSIRNVAPTGKTWAEARAGMERGEVWRHNGMLFSLADLDGQYVLQHIDGHANGLRHNACLTTKRLDATDWEKVDDA